MFFLISLGLGYPTLNRYDPRATAGLSDSQTYYEMAVHGPAAVDPQLRSRVLVPMLAGSVAAMARGRSGTWDPVFCGFLVVNSFFAATTAFLLADVARRLAAPEATAVLAGGLYLLNFETANVLLSGMVDSADGCFLMATVWSLVTGRVWWLPLWGMLGAASKETFVPLAMVFLLVWWLRERRNGRAILAAGLAAVVGIAVLQSVLAGRITMPWEFAASVGQATGHWQALAGKHGEPQYRVHGDLAGADRDHGLARNAESVGRCQWHGSHRGTGARGMAQFERGAAARPYFTVAGPLLSLSAARWLGRA